MMNVMFIQVRTPSKPRLRSRRKLMMMAWTTTP